MVVMLAVMLVQFAKLALGPPLMAAVLTCMAARAGPVRPHLRRYLLLCTVLRKCYAMSGSQYRPDSTELASRVEVGDTAVVVAERRFAGTTPPTVLRLPYALS
eukprot:3535652-Rhodomonas_salina.1